MKLIAAPENYAGREQSLIKHLFLTEYLKEAAFKTLQKRSPVFNFVDAFAGPWRVEDSNYSDASFDQAIRVLDAVKKQLDPNGIKGLRIRFCFCEKRNDSFQKLRDYADGKTKYEIHIFQGSFEENLKNISNVCRNGFTFTFIDPTGWNVESRPIFEFLKNNRGEFLLNFMSDHVNRHAEYPLVSQSFGRFLADPMWESDFNALPKEDSNEIRMLTLLKRKIKASGAAIYVPDMPIKNPRKERIKMRLVLGTFSRVGLEVFRDVQDRVERSEIETRNRIRDENSLQVSLIPDEELVRIEQGQSGVGGREYRTLSREKILAILFERGAVIYRDLLAEVLEEIPIRRTQLGKLLNELKSSQLIEFSLPPRKRVAQLDTNIRLTPQTTQL